MGYGGAVTPHLFISYRRTQLGIARPAVEALRAAGVDCFFDLDDSDPLADFPEGVRQGIAGSHALLAWWSQDYGESEHCLAEFKLAWQHARRQSSDVGRRVWVLNPEPHAAHVLGGELNARNFLQPPPPGGEARWAQTLLARLQPLLPEGPLADERMVAPRPRLINVPPASHEFTGRTAELLRIHSALHPPQICSAGLGAAVQIHGMGGIGKTALATMYAHEFAHAYPGGVVWLSLAGYDPGNPDPYLWVLGNVPVLLPESERDGILAFWRSPTASGRTLVTTRDSRPAAGFAAQRLDVLGDDDALRLLALTLHAQGDLVGARALSERTLEVCRLRLGEEHPDTLRLMGNVALTLYMMGNIAGARALNERSVEIYRRVLGDEHPDTLRTMGNLGLILQTQRHLANARDLQQRVLETQCRVLGDEHPQTVMSLNNLALTVHSQGRFARSARARRARLLPLSQTPGGGAPGYARLRLESVPDSREARGPRRGAHLARHVRSRATAHLVRHILAARLTGQEGRDRRRLRHSRSSDPAGRVGRAN
jgi:Tetratricopeptide repeat/TIR domain